ncbi:MAG: spermidine/putrescine ABC transporter substrate-binding protein [Anaerolineae bacterium]|nr:spermidine/putrescine ABC transporter substrate-binding protein [Anaerolineae bacterium]
MKSVKCSSLAMILSFVMVVLSACVAPTPTPTVEQPTELVFRNWGDDISQEILDTFEAQSGIHVNYVPYESQEEALEEMRAGAVYDVVVLENQLIVPAVEEGLLAEIDYSNVPNFRNISANFRDLSYDPNNAHTVPYSWGITGLVVRTDLVEEPVTGWSDLWNPSYQGRLMAWPLSRYVIGAALQSLGYSLNSEDPDELDAALERLLELKPHITLVEWEPAVAAPYLVSGEVVVAMGQADDVIEGQTENPAIAYVMPQEGGILWGDNFTIPANSPNKAAAEQFINFLLEAEISAQIINETYYWLPNDAAMEFVDAELRENTAIFPTTEMLRNAEIILPLSAEGEALYAQVWDAFMAEE